MIGCAAVFGGLVWLVCFLTLVLTGTELRMSVVMSGLLGGFFFVAVLICGLLDWLRESARMRRVRQRLLQRPPASNDVATKGVAADYLATFLATRRSIADFFDVPEDRLRADDLLDRDYSYLALEPNLHSFVIERAMAEYEIHVSTWQFDSSGLETLADFVLAVDRTLAEMNGRTLRH